MGDEDTYSSDDDIPDLLEGNDILVFGPNGKIIKTRTRNQQQMAIASDKNDILFAVRPVGNGKTYTAVALAVKALKNKLVRNSNSRFKALS